MKPARQNSSNALSGLLPKEDSSLWMNAFTPSRLAGLIALLLFALYPGVILGTHSFFFRDFGLFTYPVAYFTHESFWRGQVPLWNPLNNCGVPFLAQWNTSVCYPLSLHVHGFSAAVVIELFLSRASAAGRRGHVLAGVSLDAKPAGGERRRTGFRFERADAQLPDVDEQPGGVKLATAGRALGRASVAVGRPAAQW